MRSNDSQKIIVVGVPKTLDDAGLSELFSGFGTVADAKIVKDANTNTSRGFGFVTFTAASAMRNAIKEMNQKKIDGRVLNVRQLVPKDQFQAKKESEGGDANNQDPSQRPCWLLRKGKCTKGANCPFSHDIKDGDFGSCFEFIQTGSCKRGDKCKFHHPEPTGNDDAKNKLQDASTEVKKKAPKILANEQSSKEEKKPRVCYSFQNGRCHRGKKCLFLHEKLPTSAVENKDKKKKQMPTKRDEFEVVTENEAGKKRRREEESESEDEVDEEEEEEEEEEKEVKNVQPKRKIQVKPSTEASKSDKAKTPASPPLKGLAAHVSNFMASIGKSSIPEEPKEPKVASSSSPSKVKRATPEKKRPQTTERPAKKQKQIEKIDMGAAFDGLSDDDNEPKSNKSVKKVVNRAQLKANREKLKKERQAKRGAKKSALARLQSKEEIELES